MAAPSNVPSWWEFNEAVLAGLREGYASSFEAPVRARGALERLSLEWLDLPEFSQIVHNAFAGPTWFRLLGLLDGDAPNATHRMIASLADDGVLRVVATTNFDTLLERAMPSAAVRNALVDDPPGAETTVIKLHGTANLPESIVDLATQKRRGIDAAWRSWLEEVFATHCVLVIGFSGADLGLGDDYLGLRAAADRTPWLAWNIRASSAPHPKALEIVTACGTRGRLLCGDLPAVLVKLGVRVASVPATPETTDARVRAAVTEWLAEPQVDSDVCGIALARLLMAADRRSAAEALRGAIRTRVRRRLRRGASLDGAARASLVLGQLATDDEHEARSMKDLDLAERALRAVVQHLRRRDGELLERAQIEYAKNMSNLAHVRAVHYLRRGDASSAESEVNRAWTYIQTLPESERVDRLAAHWQNTAGVAWLRGERNRARSLFERARAAAHDAGDRTFIEATDATLRRLALGEQRDDQADSPQR